MPYYFAKNRGPPGFKGPFPRRATHPPQNSRDREPSPRVTWAAGGPPGGVRPPLGFLGGAEPGAIPKTARAWFFEKRGVVKRGSTRKTRLPILPTPPPLFDMQEAGGRGGIRTRAGGKVVLFFGGHNRKTFFPPGGTVWGPRGFYNKEKPAPLGGRPSPGGRLVFPGALFGGIWPGRDPGRRIKGAFSPLWGPPGGGVSPHRRKRGGRGNPGPPGPCPRVLGLFSPFFPSNPKGETPWSFWGGALSPERGGAPRGPKILPGSKLAGAPGPVGRGAPPKFGGFPFSSPVSEGGKKEIVFIAPTKNPRANYFGGPGK